MFSASLQFPYNVARPVTAVKGVGIFFMMAIFFMLTIFLTLVVLTGLDVL